MKDKTYKWMAIDKAPSRYEVGADGVERISYNEEERIIEVIYKDKSKVLVFLCDEDRVEGEPNV